jgi:hypothetical protein
MVSLILFLEAQSRHSSQGEFFSRLVVSGSFPAPDFGVFWRLVRLSFRFRLALPPKRIDQPN